MARNWSSQGALAKILVYVSFLTLGGVLTAQVVHYPGENPALPKRTSTILSGVGGGAERAASSAPGSRIEIADVAPPVSANARKPVGPRFLEWERWWHGQLYGILAERRFGQEAADQIKLDSLINQDVLRLLRDRFENGSTPERAAAAVGLARLGSSSVSNDLIFALEGAPESIQSAIILAFGVGGTEDARSLLRSLVLDGRFGRRALGKPRQPVPTNIRCVALLATGMLPAKKTDDTLHQVLMSPKKFTVELHRAACLALGLHAVASVEAQEKALRYGRAVRPWNLCVEHETEYLALLDNKDLNDTCKSLLLLSLARSLPTRAVLASKIISLLDGDKPLLSRSAAAAAGDLALADPTELNQALWRRLKHGGDAATSGFVLLSLGKRADDANFKALLSHECLETTTRPYLAFALLEASQGSASRQAAATIRVRSLVSACRNNDGVGLAGTCVALGLLGDSEAVGLLASINQKHAMVTARSAAGLALGLLGHGQDASSLWRQEVRRASGFLVHDGALTMALSKTSKTAAELCQVMASRKDAYSLGGVAQAFGLLKSTESVPMLTGIIKDKKSPVEVRTFAIGALGLVLERNPGAWSRRLRSLAPIPVSSATISDVLSHL